MKKKWKITWTTTEPAGKPQSMLYTTLMYMETQEAFKMFALWKIYMPCTREHKNICQSMILS